MSGLEILLKNNGIEIFKGANENNHVLTFNPTITKCNPIETAKKINNFYQKHLNIDHIYVIIKAQPTTEDSPEIATTHYFCLMMKNVYNYENIRFFTGNTITTEISDMENPEYTIYKTATEKLFKTQTKLVRSSFTRADWRTP